MFFFLRNFVKSIAVLTCVAAIFATVYMSPGSFGVIQGHRPVVIQGHSPVNLIVTDESTGLQTGCVGGVSVTNIPSSTYSGCGSEPQSVNITTPSIGSFDVEWTSTLTGNQQGQFSITVTICTKDNGDVKNNGHPEGICSPQDKDDKPVTYTLVGETPIGAGDSGNAQFTNNPDGTITVPVTETVTQTNTVTVPTTITETATATSITTIPTSVTSTATETSTTTIPVTATSTQIFTTSSTTVPTTVTSTVSETTSTNYMTSSTTKVVTRYTGECSSDGDPQVASLPNVINAATTTPATSSTVTVTTTVTNTVTSTTTAEATSTTVSPTTATYTIDATTTDVVPTTVTGTVTQSSTTTVPVTSTQTNTVTHVPTTTVTKTATNTISTCFTDDDYGVQTSSAFPQIAGLALIGMIGLVFTARGSFTGVARALKIR